MLPQNIFITLANACEFTNLHLKTKVNETINRFIGKLLKTLVKHRTLALCDLNSDKVAKPISSEFLRDKMCARDNQIYFKKKPSSCAVCTNMHLLYLHVKRLIISLCHKFGFKFCV